MTDVILFLIFVQGFFFKENHYPFSLTNLKKIKKDLLSTNNSKMHMTIEMLELRQLGCSESADFMCAQSE